MDLHALNRRKNFWLRAQKLRLAQFLLNAPRPEQLTPETLSSLRKIVFLRNDDKLGDMIVMSSVLRELKKQLPKAQISVIAGPTSAQLLAYNPHVSHVYIGEKNLVSAYKLGRRLRGEKIDLFVSFDTEQNAPSLLLLRLLNPRFAFGLNTQKIQLYNLSAIVKGNEHITQCYQKLFDTLHLRFDNKQPELFLPDSAQEHARTFAQHLPSVRVALNAFAASKHRSLSVAQVNKLIKEFPSVGFILLGSPSQRRTLRRAGLPSNAYFPPEYFNLFDMLALLKEADLLISPDTMWVHAAAALHTSQICLFKQSDPQNKLRWKPLTQKATVFDAPDEFSTLDTSFLFPLIQTILKCTK